MAQDLWKICILAKMQLLSILDIAYYKFVNIFYCSIKKKNVWEDVDQNCLIYYPASSLTTFESNAGHRYN